MDCCALICERKKFLFLIVVCCSIGVHLAYVLYWKETNLPVILSYQSNNSKLSSIPVATEKFMSTLKSSDPPLVDIVSVWRSSIKARGINTISKTEVDIHVEDPVHGHAGHVASLYHNSSLLTTSSHPTNTGRQGRITIAIGGGITSQNIKNIHKGNMVAKLPFYRDFLPTFCRTFSSGFTYKFYLAYDDVDPVFRDGQLQAAFRTAFNDEILQNCRNADVSLHLVECSHTKKPAWAQNDAMLEAYLDHVDYFYRVNDDTRMLTGGWTEKFISKLNSYDPPLVGVVGPNHSGGNMAILTYDFVHRTHIDIFGFYYPRLFSDWWADGWMTRVYLPGRSTKLYTIMLQHVMSLGQRYPTRWEIEPHVQARLDQDKQAVNWYVITHRVRLECVRWPVGATVHKSFNYLWPR